MGIDLNICSNRSKLGILWKNYECYIEATDKLKEECIRLNEEIKKIDNEICEMEPQIKILKSNYDVQIESVPLNQQSLINQRVHKKCLLEKIKKHEEETDTLIDEYTQYISTCKDKLQFANPTYKILQTKRTELRKIKIRCMDLEQQIIELKNINKQKWEIKHQLFYNDIIEFAQNWLNHKKYLEAMYYLKEETKKEREWMKKLAEVTDMLKQKQTGKFLRNQNKSFNVPHIEFSANEVNKNKEEVTSKAKVHPNDPFIAIQAMLEKKDTDITSKTNASDDRKLKFNINHSKVRILENITLKQVHGAEKSSNFKSKEERNKEIAAKIEKVVQNFNKSISRQNSTRKTGSSQNRPKVNKNEEKLKDQLSQQSNLSLEMSQNTQKISYEGSGATQAIQNLNLTGKDARKPETINQRPTEYNLQFSNKQLPCFKKDNDITKSNPVQKHPNENYGSITFSQNAGFLTQAVSKINKSENTAPNVNKNSQFFIGLDNKLQSSNSGQQPFFIMPTSDINTKNDNSFQNNNAFTEASFLADDTDDYEGGYKYPKFSPNFEYSNQPTEENNTNNMGANLFSFGQTNSFYKFS